MWRLASVFRDIIERNRAVAALHEQQEHLEELVQERTARPALRVAKGALQMLNGWTPDLIRMDLRMPGLSGQDTIRHLKASEQTRRIPVIAVTASAFIDEQAEALRAGADAYLRKPFKEADLFGILNERTRNPNSRPIYSPGSRGVSG